MRNRALLAALVLAATTLHPHAFNPPPAPKPPSRRDEKRDAALAKAQAKRDRRNAKRLKNQGTRK